MIRTKIDRLNTGQSLRPEELKSLVLLTDPELQQYLREKGRQKAQEHFGNGVYIRGLIEFTNYCANDCYYCGLRRSNRKVRRYRLDRRAILHCCKTGYELGFRTFVLQGGEDQGSQVKEMTGLIEDIRRSYPDCAITLSIGERSAGEYQAYFNAGADRYLLRHETANEEHYRRLHPDRQSLKQRKACLYQLKAIGYQAGTGFMVGSPYQTADHLVADLQFIQELQPQMIGIGPFLPHRDTPFGTFPPGSLSQTLNLIAILRLMHPTALIPATTALGSLVPDGREQGILCGANVVMPNLSPVQVREKYMLYNNKLFSGAEAAEGLRNLEKRLNTIGYRIAYGRGDYQQPHSLQERSTHVI